MIPTVAIVPVLIAAFAVLAFDHYRLNPLRPVRNIRFCMMVSAVILMFIQILLSWMSRWISLAIFVTALVWLATACLLVRRRMAG